MDKCSDGSPRRKRCRENNNSAANLLEQLEREIDDESSENDNSMNGDHLTNTVPPGILGTVDRALYLQCQLKGIKFQLARVLSPVLSKCCPVCYLFANKNQCTVGYIITRAIST